jgi:hypothetical protein
LSPEGSKRFNLVCSQDVLDMTKVIKSCDVDLRTTKGTIMNFLENEHFNQQDIRATKQASDNLAILVAYLEKFTHFQKQIIQNLTDWAKRKKNCEKMEMWN